MNGPRIPPRAFSLIELTVTLGVLVLLCAAIGSISTIASRAVTTPRQEAVSVIQERAVLAQMLDEIALARTVTQATATSITLTIADQNKDGQDETIVYFWSGIAGDSLTRTRNEGASAVIATSVSLLDLKLVAQAVESTVPGPPVEGPEQMLARYETTNSTTQKLNGTLAVGQYVHPVIPFDAVSWRPTRLCLHLASVDQKLGSLNFKVNSANTNGSINTEVLTTQTLFEYNFNAVAGWYDIALGTTRQLGPTEAMFFSIATTNFNVGDACLVTERTSGVSDRYAYMTTSANRGGTWTTSHLGSLAYKMYGRVTQPSDFVITTDRVVGVAALLSLGETHPSIGSREMLGAPVAPVSAAVVDGDLVGGLPGVINGLVGGLTNGLGL